MPTLRIQALLVIFCLLFGGKPVRGATGNSFNLSSEQITYGPQHHFFGYIGQCKTIPWNASGRYIVALRTDFHDRLPGPEDPAAVILIDTKNGYRETVVDRTLQQGTMLYWNPESPETQFFFNDRDPVDGRIFTVLYDIAENRRIREYRYPGFSIGNSGVAQGGGSFLAINYGRLARLRPVTGYAGALDETMGRKAPENDGIFLVDVDSGELRLLVSYSQLAGLLRSTTFRQLDNGRWTPIPETEAPSAEDQPDPGQAELYINHTLWSRNNDRIYFFVRGRRERQSLWIDAPCSINADGSGLTVHTLSIGGHPEWAEGDLLIGEQAGRQVYFDVVKKRIYEERSLGAARIFPDPGGDISLSPDGNWFVNGYSSKDRQTNTYVVMRMSDGAHRHSEAFDRGPYSKGDLRIDPAPRWNRTNDALLVSAWTEAGSRQLFVLRIEEIDEE